MPPKSPAEPWRSFLDDLSLGLDEPTELHCIGGFVQAYELVRATADIDVPAVVPHSYGGRLMEVAGKQSVLRQKHGIYLDVVTIVRPGTSLLYWELAHLSRSVRTAVHLVELRNG